MIEPRAASGLLVSAMIRRIEAEGGHAMVIAKGDAVAGAILLLFADRGVISRIAERVYRFDGGFGLDFVGPADPDKDRAAGEYIERRRKSDPDLWVVELDHPEAGRIAGEVLI